MDNQNSIGETFMYVRDYADGVNLSIKWFKGFCDLIESGWTKQYEWLGETYKFESLKQFIEHQRGLKADSTAIFLATEACSKNSKFDPYAKQLLDLFDQENFSPVIEKAKANPIADHGAIGRGRKLDRVDNINSINKGGTSQEYLARRLARDFPGVLDKVGKNKEYKSMRAAAIAVGIVKEKSMIAIPGEPSVLAKNLESKCDSEYLAEMADELGYIAITDSGGLIASKLYQKLDDAQLREIYINLSEYLGEEF